MLTYGDFGGLEVARKRVKKERLIANLKFKLEIVDQEITTFANSQ